MPRMTRDLLAKHVPFRQSISESDIDWLLCVELNTNSHFRKWLGRLVFAKIEEISHVYAWRSISDASGESDLLWLVKGRDSGKSIAVLIENKINASSQPRQYDRYVERGRSYQSDGVCDEFVVMLVAPERYRSKDSEMYRVRVSYQQIRNWFELDKSERSEYFVQLFNLAINKSDELADVDSEMFSFRRKIWELAKAEFPHLNVPDPHAANVSKTRYMVYMRPEGHVIAYKPIKKKGKFVQCVVDLELRDPCVDVANAKEQYGNQLQSCIRIRKAGNSVAFRRDVPLVVPPKFDAESVRDAMVVASELLEWWRQVESDR